MGSGSVGAGVPGLGAVVGADEVGAAVGDAVRWYPHCVPK